MIVGNGRFEGFHLPSENESKAWLEPRAAFFAPGIRQLTILEARIAGDFNAAPLEIIQSGPAGSWWWHSSTLPGEGDKTVVVLLAGFAGLRKPPPGTIELYPIPVINDTGHIHGVLVIAFSEDAVSISEQEPFDSGSMHSMADRVKAEHIADFPEDNSPVYSSIVWLSDLANAGLPMPSDAQKSPGSLLETAVSRIRIPHRIPSSMDRVIKQSRLRKISMGVVFVLALSAISMVVARHIASVEGKKLSNAEKRYRQTKKEIEHERDLESAVVDLSDRLAHQPDYGAALGRIYAGSNVLVDRTILLSRAAKGLSWTLSGTSLVRVEDVRPRLMKDLGQAAVPVADAPVLVPNPDLKTVILLSGEWR